MSQGYRSFFNREILYLYTIWQQCFVDHVTGQFLKEQSQLQLLLVAQTLLSAYAIQE